MKERNWSLDSRYSPAYGIPPDGPGVMDILEHIHVYIYHSPVQYLGQREVTANWPPSVLDILRG
jgi:hypothetical protein